MDSARRTTAPGVTRVFLLLFLVPLALPAQRRVSISISRVRQLYSQGRYGEIAAQVRLSTANSADLDLYLGLSLARLARWPQARAAFEAGLTKQPKNERFFLELAGVDYRTNHFHDAKYELRRALALRPGDAYAHNFLATIYMIEGNLEAAIAQWNKIGKPRITAIRMEPEPRLRNTLLQRTFVIPPLGTLRLRDLHTTEALLGNLGIFPTYGFDLSPSQPPSPPHSFVLDFHSVQRDGWGSSRLDVLARLLGDLPTAITPRYYNFRNSAINFTSQYRWDENKRRVTATVSLPLDGNPHWRLSLRADARNENWNLRRTFHDGGAPLNYLNLERIEAGPDLGAVENGRWWWETGIFYSYRRFRDIQNLPPAAVPFFTGGGSLEYRAQTGYRILDVPERRLTIDTSAAGKFGKNFARVLGPYGAFEFSAVINWFPKLEGNDYQTTIRFHAGRAFGSATLDQLYQMGVGRDTDLWVRGISATRGGLKGNAPLGREFALWNWDTYKTIFEDGYVTAQLGPFLDVGRMADSSGMFGSPGWLWDPGLEMNVRLFGDVQLIVAYGRDLHSGSGAFYESASH